MNALDIEKHLSSLNFWNKISDNERNIILNATVAKKFKKGDYIHTDSVRCTGIIYVLSGNAKVYMISEDGREITLYRIGPGEYCVLSASCVLKAITFEVSVQAEEPMQALIINPKAFLSVIDNNVYAENCALHTAVERFSTVMWTMQQVLFTRMDKRLAVYLYERCMQTKSLILKTTHDEIASNIGSSREVVSRMLKYFSQEGYVKTLRGSIEVLNKKGLLELTK